jgi:hypothetical protein
MWIATTIVVAILVILAFIILSPITLGLLSGDAGYWTRLGDIGQAYGAASALISVLALTGVAASLFFQARESKASRDQALRALHLDLMKMAMQDEVYSDSWGPFFDNDDHTEQRQHMYINLIIEHWRMMCEFGSMTETHLRSVAHIVLIGEPGRRFWANGRELRLRSAGSRLEKKFHRVLEEEYQKVLIELAANSTSEMNVDRANDRSEIVGRTREAADRIVAAFGTVLAIVISYTIGVNASRRRRPKK